MMINEKLKKYLVKYKGRIVLQPDPESPTNSLLIYILSLKTGKQRKSKFYIFGDITNVELLEFL